MYNRVLRSLLAVNGHCLSKCVNATRSFSEALKINLQCARHDYRRNLMNIRQCTTFAPHEKDKIAAQQLEEYLKDPDNEKHYKVLQLEIDVMRQSGENVPSNLKPRHWMELVQLNSRLKRRKYLNFVFGIEKKKENEAEKKKINLQEKEMMIDDSDVPNYLRYRLGGNSLFLRFYDGEMNNFYNWRLLQAIMYGQKLVLDCGYEDKMTRQENKYCARQLQLAFAANRSVKDPFDLHFCNFNTKGFLHQELHSYIPTMYEPHFPMNITEKSYLDLFDKHKLIYLTPDCNQELSAFDHEAVYIIGSIVDKVSGLPLSMAKAKREGIRMAKLPIDKYLDFGGGSGKSLTLNQMIDILVDLKRTSDWSYALRHVPRRKLFAYRQHQNQKKIARIIRDNQNTYGESSSPQDYSIQSRNKFRNK